MLKTRANLQLLSKQSYGNFPLKMYEKDKFLDTVWHEMRSSFSHGNTIFAFDPYNYFRIEIPVWFRNELLELLKKEYMDCTVSYVETIRGKDMVEKLILISWS